MNIKAVMRWCCWVTENGGGCQETKGTGALQYKDGLERGKECHRHWRLIWGGGGIVWITKDEGASQEQGQAFLELGEEGQSPCNHCWWLLIGRGLRPRKQRSLVGRDWLQRRTVATTQCKYSFSTAAAGRKGTNSPQDAHPTSLPVDPWFR